MPVLGDDLGLEVVSGDGWDCLHVTGELDIYSNHLLRGLVQMESLVADVLILDLSGVTFLDSSGIGSIAFTMREVGARGAELALVTDTTHLLKLVRMAGLHKLVAVYPSVENAVSELSDVG